MHCRCVFLLRSLEASFGPTIYYDVSLESPGLPPQKSFDYACIDRLNRTGTGLKMASKLEHARIAREASLIALLLISPCSPATPLTGTVMEISNRVI